MTCSLDYGRLKGDFIMSDRSITPLPPADFTPEMSNYKTLQPFRYWCQKVLPLVYDDSLSYYEMLCKVIDYLNKTMEDVETLHVDVTNLHKSYAELQSYVNNYFSSLDVQEEINKKLDDMASKGELTDLLFNAITTQEIKLSTPWFTSTTKIIQGSTFANSYLIVGYTENGASYLCVIDYVNKKILDMQSYDMFNHPNSITYNGEYLYVCDSGKIWKVELVNSVLGLASEVISVKNLACIEFFNGNYYILTTTALYITQDLNTELKQFCFIPSDFLFTPCGLFTDEVYIYICVNNKVNNYLLKMTTTGRLTGVLSISRLSYFEMEEPCYKNGCLFIPFINAPNYSAIYCSAMKSVYSNISNINENALPVTGNFSFSLFLDSNADDFGDGTSEHPFNNTQALMLAINKTNIPVTVNISGEYDNLTLNQFSNPKVRLYLKNVICKTLIISNAPFIDIYGNLTCDQLSCTRAYITFNSDSANYSYIFKNTIKLYYSTLIGNISVTNLLRCNGINYTFISNLDGGKYIGSGLIKSNATININNFTSINTRVIPRMYICKFSVPLTQETTTIDVKPYLPEWAKQLTFNYVNISCDYTPTSERFDVSYRYRDNTISVISERVIDSLPFNLIMII